MPQDAIGTRRDEDATRDDAHCSAYDLPKPSMGCIATGLHRCHSSGNLRRVDIAY